MLCIHEAIVDATIAAIVGAIVAPTGCLYSVYTRRSSAQPVAPTGCADDRLV
jgi:hypothetical protein